MLNELNHRVKNMLAVVQSVANQTLRSTTDPNAFAEVFGKRIGALAAAHSLLTAEHWTGVDLSDLAHASLLSFIPDGDERIRMEGPAVRLSPNATVSFVMALHELGTNATKYGALSNRNGQVDLTWETRAVSEGSEGETLTLTWNEHDGPVVVLPEREGFGRRMLEKGIARELDGHVEFDYKPSGLVCRMAFPLDKVTSRADR